MSAQNIHHCPSTARRSRLHRLKTPNQSKFYGGGSGGICLGGGCSGGVCCFCVFCFFGGSGLSFGDVILFLLRRLCVGDIDCGSGGGDEAA